jgi:hypothetical protein
VGVGKVLQFPRREPTVVERLDASSRGIHQLKAASGLTAEEIRAEALGARLDMAGLRDAMYDILWGSVAPPGHSTVIDHVWARVERLLDQVTICALCSYEESGQPERSYIVRVRLRMTCQSTLLELRHLRSLLSQQTTPKTRLDES